MHAKATITSIGVPHPFVLFQVDVAVTTTCQPYSDIKKNFTGSVRTAWLTPPSRGGVPSHDQTFPCPFPQYNLSSRVTRKQLLDFSRQKAGQLPGSSEVPGSMADLAPPKNPGGQATSDSDRGCPGAAVGRGQATEPNRSRRDAVRHVEQEWPLLANFG